MLVCLIVYTLCFQVPFRMPYSPVRVHPLRFTPLQPFGAYTCQEYVHPHDGHWPMPWMHWVAVPSTALDRREPYATQSAVLQLFQQYGGAYSFGSLVESHLIPLPSYMVGRGHLFQVWFHLMAQSTLNLWWALHLMILVCWSGIRLVSLLTPGLQRSLLLIHTFTLGSWVRCHHKPTLHLNQGVRIIPF